jgi:protein subunit release factor B
MPFWPAADGQGLLAELPRRHPGNMPEPLRVTSRLTVPAAELSWRFSRSGGPGGQNVNTTDSRVEV